MCIQVCKRSVSDALRSRLPQRCYHIIRGESKIWIPPSTPLLGHSLLTNQEAVLPLNNQRDWTQETLMRTVGVPCVVPTIRAHACNNRCMSAANAKG